jgi:hypothetical protein
MALGASWNATLDAPLSDAEADEILDRSKREEVREAVERDRVVADAAISDAAEVADSGVLRELVLVPGGAESLTIQVERRAVQALAEARAGASIRIGTQIGPFGPTTEGLVFETTQGGRLRPTFVSVNIATGRTHRVIRRRGKYLLQTKGGRTILSGDNLAWLLLLFALAEKERRDREAERENRIAAAASS